MRINNDVTDNVRKIYYTIEEVADLCDVHRGAIKRISADYKIEPIQRGKSKIFTEDQANQVLVIVNLEKKSKAELITDLLIIQLPRTFKMIA